MSGLKQDQRSSPSLGIAREDEGKALATPGSGGAAGELTGARRLQIRQQDGDHADQR